MLIDLAVHREWRDKCREEVRGLIAHHVGDSVSSSTLYEKLAAIPFSAWEDQLPVLDACIREFQRISICKVVMRRNVGEEFKIGGEGIARGDFLAYGLGEVHLNPEYFLEPYKYDPSRWLRPDSVAYPFLGWGAGRHPCTGMKVAKSEMKLILAVFLTRYEYDLVDGDGKFPNPLPVPNRDDFYRVRAG